MDGTAVVKCEPEWSDTEESSSCFQGLPLEADLDDTGDIKVKLEGIATLVPKVERESSPSPQCEDYRRQLPLEADLDDTGNINIKLEGIATLVPKVERESSPFRQCIATLVPKVEGESSPFRQCIATLVPKVERESSSFGQCEDYRSFQRLPLEADCNDNGDIKKKQECIATLVPKVERESSPFRQCVATLVPKVERESSPSAQCEDYRRRLPLEADLDDTEDIKRKLEGIATLVPKVERESSPVRQCIATLVPKIERESSPLGECEDYRSDEEQLPICTNDRTASSSGMVDQNETEKQGRTGYSRDLEEPSFQYVGENDHNYAIQTPGTDRSGDGLQNKLGESHITMTHSVQPLQSILKKNFLDSREEQNALRTYARASARTCTPPFRSQTPTNNRKHYHSCDEGFNLKASLNRHVHTEVGGSDHNYAMPTWDLCIGTPRTHTGGDVLENKLVKSYITKSPYVQPVQSRLNKYLLNSSRVEQNVLRTSNFPFHLLTRTINKKYCCCLCDKSFILKASLKKHILTHAGVDSFFSRVGYKSFTVT